MVGMVVTISPSFSLYRIVVFPAASSPTIRILISFLPKRPLNKLANTFPIVTKLSKNERETRYKNFSVSLSMVYVARMEKRRQGKEDL